MAKRARTKTPATQEHEVWEVPKRVSLSSYQQAAWGVIDTNTVSVLAGEAGSGKTFAALHYGIEAIKAGRFEDLIVVRSPIEAGRSRMGFIPGTVAEKMAPWCAPMIEIAKLLKFDKEIKFLAPGFIQGMTFGSSFVLCDEAQNMDLMEWEMVVTRLGKTSKICFCGDAHQDTRRMGGMVPFMEATAGVTSIGQYLFPDEANQRHPVVRDVTRALRKYREAKDGF
jgi:phosphate starvation-inducible PhoH-like protein